MGFATGFAKGFFGGLVAQQEDEAKAELKRKDFANRMAEDTIKEFNKDQIEQGKIVTRVNEASKAAIALGFHPAVVQHAANMAVQSKDMKYLDPEVLSRFSAEDTPGPAGGSGTPAQTPNPSQVSRTPTGMPNPAAFAGQESDPTPAQAENAQATRGQVQSQGLTPPDMSEQTMAQGQTPTPSSMPMSQAQPNRFSNAPQGPAGPPRNPMIDQTDQLLKMGGWRDKQRSGMVGAMQPNTAQVQQFAQPGGAKITYDDATERNARSKAWSYVMSNADKINNPSEALNLYAQTFKAEGGKHFVAPEFNKLNIWGDQVAKRQIATTERKIIQDAQAIATMNPTMRDPRTGGPTAEALSAARLNLNQMGVTGTGTQGIQPAPGQPNPLAGRDSGFGRIEPQQQQQAQPRFQPAEKSTEMEAYNKEISNQVDRVYQMPSGFTFEVGNPSLSIPGLNKAVIPQYIAVKTIASMAAMADFHQNGKPSKAPAEWVARAREAYANIDQKLKTSTNPAKDVQTWPPTDQLIANIIIATRKQAEEVMKPTQQ